MNDNDGGTRARLDEWNQGINCGDLVCMGARLTLWRRHRILDVLDHQRLTLLMAPALGHSR